VGYFEPPDLIVAAFHGAVMPVHVDEYVAKRAMHFDGKPHILTLLDVRDLTHAPPETRKAIARLKDPRPQATAIIGAGFQYRVLAQMIVKAAHLFTGKLIELAFFDDEENARAWLEEMRPRMRPKTTSD